ncbi:MAG: hypothetical protein R2708_15445 [Vicinamibacterales bacterium]
MHSPFELPLLRAVTSTPDAESVDLLVALYAGEPTDAYRARLPVAARVEFEAALSRGEALSISAMCSWPAPRPARRAA